MTRNCDTLQDVYELAKEHAQRGIGPRDNYLETFEGSVMVDGVEVSFHIDNSAGIYYDVGSITI